jgi:hypothetical protein
MRTDFEWRNLQTREAYIDLVESVDDPLGFAKQWCDIGNGDAHELLAAQLARDAQVWARECPGPGVFERSLMRAGLARVDWKQVAERIIERARPMQVAQADDDEETCC